MGVITTTDELAKAAKALRAERFVALDTEFHRETTYWPKLCLVQAAGGSTEALIDPLAEGLDLAPLLELLADDAVLKVFHAARQDLEIFWNLMGGLPTPIFDTQIGAMAGGYGDSISYDGLVQAMLRRPIDKSSRFTDWARRPLTEAQLAYALADVTHLRDLFPRLEDRLEQTGRRAWLAEEHAALTDPENFDTDPARAWKRLKLRRTQGDYVLALQVAAAWRERQAQQRDVPRGRVLKDDALYEIAEQRPRDADAFERLRIVPKGFGRSRAGAELIGQLNEAFAQAERPKIETQRAPNAASSGPTAELLKVLLRCVAEEHGIAPRLIANAADVEAIAADDEAEVPALSGWRRELYGEQALALKQGRLALTLRRGKVVVQPLG